MRAHLTHFAGSLFRRHVTWRSQDRTTHGQVRLNIYMARQAEIRDARLVPGIKQNIGWFQVAMQNAAFMRVTA